MQNNIIQRQGAFPLHWSMFCLRWEALNSDSFRDSVKWKFIVLHHNTMHFALPKASIAYCTQYAMLLCLSQACCHSLYDRIHRMKTYEEPKSFTKGLIFLYNKPAQSMNKEKTYATQQWDWIIDYLIDSVQIITSIWWFWEKHVCGVCVCLFTHTYAHIPNCIGLASNFTFLYYETY